ncbi:MAG: UDP-3-O-(3-hydroxymyristoyl)glucosamine N-acyltransferase [SAR324 cluster bacterium]|nr:UDP-3-O-(3-hydroxymyristoyl)glucosamine N-acyltransferase [SAR324 cluster bacterium]
MPWTVKKICQKLGLNFSGNGELILVQVCGLNRLLPGAAVFITNSKDLSRIAASEEIAVIAPPEISSSHHTIIFSTDPLATHTQITYLLHVSPIKSKGIHPMAAIGENVILGKEVTIDAQVVLYQNVKIGDYSVLRAGVVVMENSTIGESCLIYPNVSIRENCRIGNRVIIHSGTVIGSDGFGYFQRKGIHHKIPQIGGVILEDDVEIGAGCTIDRSRFYNTVVGRGSKFDNQVHIAHNVEIGEHSLLTAQVGIAGSVTTGHHLVMGGQSGIADQIDVGSEVTLLSRALITKNTEDHEVVGGAPGRPAKKWKRVQALINRLDQLFDRVKRLESLIEKKTMED